MYGDDDLDTVLLGGGLNPVHDGYDPFSEGVGEGDGTGDTDDGDVDSAIVYNLDFRDGGFVRSNGEAIPNDDRPILGPGPAPSTIGAREERERQATDAGIGNIRRIADDRGGNTSTGVAGRKRSEGVASSIGEAAERIRAESSIPLSESEQRAGIDSLDDGTVHRGKIKRTYERRVVSAPPVFQAVEFEAMMMSLKANTNGDWIVQVKVPSEYRQQATSLGDAYGLALQVSITRKRHDSEANGS